ncbi:unnamed protein product [Symbiodinium sp. CCMP2592]|nr:unnamed protein product [Symbiodinium sp. CCMP2592]
MALTDEMKVEIGRILDSEEGVNVRIQKLFKLFLDSGLARHETVPPSAVLVHPSNRGGSMINGHDVVAKGELLTKQGVRLDLLEASSVAFTLSKHPDKRNAQVAANQALASSNPDLLAPPSGGERYLSVGSSHSTAYMRALLAGIIPESTVTKQEGPAKTCLHTGWRWLILEDLLEEEFPSLPMMIASGLNSSNQVLVNQSEVEVLMTMGRYVSLHGMTVQQAKMRCLETEPACKDYIDVLAHFAARYGGGIGFPLLEFLGHFSKVHGASLVLGSEFIRAVTNFDFKVEGNLLPCLRIALLAAQISSPVSADKVAKLLSKTDVEKLRALKDKGPLVEAETLLKGCWETVQAATNVQEKRKMQAYGRCSVRVALFLCQKEKQGREGTEHESLTTISQAFGMELLGMTAPPASSSTDSTAVENLLDASRTDVILKQHKHLEVGGSYVHKNHGSQIFTMLGVQNGQVQFQHVPLVGAPVIVEVPASAELANWKRTKKVQATVLDAEIAKQYFVSASTIQAEAFELGQAQLELYREFSGKHDGKDPSKVKDGCWVGKYLLQPSRPVSDFEKLDEKTLLVPYWYVRTTNELAQVNMTKVQQQLGTLTVPSFLNKRDLAVGELLYTASDSLIQKEQAPVSVKLWHPCCLYSPVATVMESMDVEVASVLQIKTKNHLQGLVVPSDLLIEHEEKKYLKLNGSHWWLCKLLCPEVYKTQKNVSLANTSAMKEVCQAVLAGFLKKEEGDEGEELFDKKPDDKKSLKRKRDSSGPRVKSITLPNEVVAEFYLENHQSSCPAVSAEPESLEAVLGYLKAGCEDCANAATRAYQKTGKYRKK